MDREIKFRAWDRKQKIMIQPDGIEFMVGGIKVFDVDAGDGWAYLNEGFENLEQTYDLMQYTGLTDKHGKKIYEGDIIKGWRNSIYTVLFVEKRGGYYPFAQGDGCGCCDDEVEYDPDECQVVGNIYANPNLIKED